MPTPDRAAALATQKRPRSRKSIAHVPSSSLGEDKENAGGQDEAGQNQTIHAGKRSTTNAAAKKSRSKSLGPGGLDALREGTGNRRKSNAPPLSIKSILKPSIPLSPLRPIPSRSSGRTGQAGKVASQKDDSGSLVDVSVSETNTASSVPVWGTETLLNPFEISGEKAQEEAAKDNPQIGEDEQVAAIQREEAAKREKDRRDARRKTLANRRVSFATEATLHTFDAVEYFRESMSSTDSSRRASATSGASEPSTSQFSSSPQAVEGRPTTPLEQQESPAGPVSPAHQRDLHQKKRRRASSASIVSNGSEGQNEAFSSSPFSGSSTGTADDDGTGTFSVANDDTFNSDSDADAIEGNSTMMSIDSGDSTHHSISSAYSAASQTGGSSGRLDEALRQASRQANTQAFDFAANGDQTMDIATDETTTAFQPWSRQSANPARPLEDLTSMQDQENQDPFQAMQGSGRKGRKSVGFVNSSTEDSSLGDVAMDLTMPVGGGIQDNEENATIGTLGDEDEQLSMELTTVMGGVLPGKGRKSFGRRQSMGNGATRRMTVLSEETNGMQDETFSDDAAMDMTVAEGAIFPASQTAYEDHTQGMDMTTAVGGILSEPQEPLSPSMAKALMQDETDIGVAANSPIGVKRSSVTSGRVAQKTPQVNTKPTRRSTRSAGRNSSASVTSSPQKSPSLIPNGSAGKLSTPRKQLTPVPPKPTTPGKTPPSANIAMRSASPRRLFKTHGQHSAHSERRTSATGSPQIGISTPSMVLAPRRRNSSNIGIDKEGLGSPMVSSKLDRRRSIDQEASEFSLTPQRGQKRLRIEDPRAMGDEVEREREEERRREDGLSILEKEADVQETAEKDATANLREMIGSLTPKKKMKGRKSLHVGTAKGVLGKRPAELDQDDDEDEDEENDFKRLRESQESPVKNVRLPPPPSKSQTTGRSAKSPKVTPRKNQVVVARTPPTVEKNMARATTPTSQGRFRNAEALSSEKVPVPKMEEDVPAIEQPIVPDTADEPIHLQDFLNMTSIRFMELTTTKRRPTVMPGTALGSSQSKREGRPSHEVDARASNGSIFEQQVAAGACTVPMLELYQHSCRELKKYISDGRKIVREIETDTFEENPPLFREYISAPPNVKVIMDGQFKNVKTHARLLSKAMWYEWRMKLLDGLKEGLIHIGDGMVADEKALSAREELFRPVYEPLKAEHEMLETRKKDLEIQLNDLQSCDQVELEETRTSLRYADQELNEKKQLIEELRARAEQTENSISSAKDRKADCTKVIDEANKTKEQYRGWNASELSGLKSRIDALEKRSGWSLATLHGTQVEMIFKNDLSLAFDIAALGSANIDVKCHEETSPAREFVLRLLKKDLASQSYETPRELLNIVAKTWNRSFSLEDDIQRLTVRYPTKVEIDDHDALHVRSRLLLPERSTRVDVQLSLRQIATTPGNLDIDIVPSVIYGDKISLAKMQDFMKSRIGQSNQANGGRWSSAMRDLVARISKNKA